MSAGRTLHLYNVHLGTAVLERRYQAPRLARSSTTAASRHRNRARRLQRVDARPRHGYSTRSSRASTSATTSAAAAPTPASSPFCTSITSTTRARWRSAASAAAHPPRADGVRSSAAGGGPADRVLKADVVGVRRSAFGARTSMSEGSKRRALAAAGCTGRRLRQHFTSSERRRQTPTP